MAGIAQTGGTRMLDTFTGKNPFALPSLFARLTTTTPTAAAAGTELTTGQYAGYAPLALVGASWAGASGASSAYNALLDYGIATTSSGANILGVEFWDASSGGNRLFWEPLSSIAISSGGGTHVSFPSGQFVATLALLSAGIGIATAQLNKLLDHMTGKTAFGSAPAFYLALLSSASGVAALGTELVYTGYGRVLIPLASIAAAAVVGGNVDVTLAAPVGFAADTAGTQTAATFWGCADAATVGNFLAGGSLTGGGVSAGVTPNVASGTTILRAA